MNLILPNKYHVTVTSHKCKSSNSFLRNEENLWYWKNHFRDLKYLKPALWLYFDSNVKYHENKYDKLTYKYCDPEENKLFSHLNEKPPEKKVPQRLKKDYSCPFLKNKFVTHQNEMTSSIYKEILNINRLDVSQMCGDHKSHIHCCLCDQIFSSNGNT